MKKQIQNLIVLILLLMEYGHRAIVNWILFLFKIVLILLLMEYGHRAPATLMRSTCRRS